MFCPLIYPTFSGISSHLRASAHGLRCTGRILNMSANERESEIKHIQGGNPEGPAAKPPRDPNLAGGERVQTPEEKEKARRDRDRPKEPPIIQKDVT
jgi:hypothetical protein